MIKEIAYIYSTLSMSDLEELFRKFPQLKLNDNDNSDSVIKFINDVQELGIEEEVLYELKKINS